ncbi:MAG: glycosyltransferase family 87 protein [Acidobacteriota bacterium]
MNSRLVRLLAFILLSALVCWEWTGVDWTRPLKPDQFAEYWCAARLVLSGNNPYSAETVRVLLGEMGWERSAASAFDSPPWALTWVLPFGSLPYNVGRVLWLILNLVVVMYCLQTLWRLYGSAGSLVVGWVLMLAFYPVLVLLKTGEIGSLTLLGVTLFLVWEKQRQDTLAGAACALLAIQPYLVLLVWAALLLSVWKERRWPFMRGFCAAMLGTSIVPLIFNGHLFSWYFRAASNPHSVLGKTSNLGTLVRLEFGVEPSGLVFVPALVAVIWLGLHWKRSREGWNWQDQMPLILVVSVLVSPYGWSHEQVVLLPVLAQAAAMLAATGSAGLGIVAVLVFIGFNAIAFLINQSRANDLWLLWMNPAWFTLYLAIRRRLKRVEAKIRNVELVDDAGTLEAESNRIAQPDAADRFRIKTHRANADE